QFFSALRSEFFRLRGFWRAKLSVWRFSHCDFYRFEKFDEREYAPRERDAFPTPHHPDYTYAPQPMIPIPPVSRHEFRKRFDSCRKLAYCPHRLISWFRKCNCPSQTAKAHSRELLDKFPKKTSQLDEYSEVRETFWGIYARQAICFRWILFYNLLCITPLIWLIFMWLFVWKERDLESALMPTSIMLAMLSVFWSTFLGSLKFGQDA
ncbi:hypothetical protein CC78DRAFT_472625, partial [Lojkania enalia]